MRIKRARSGEPVTVLRRLRGLLFVSLLPFKAHRIWPLIVYHRFIPKQIHPHKISPLAGKIHLQLPLPFHRTK